MGNYNGIKKFKLDNGYSFEAYIPSNVNSDTKIILYEHGDGDGYTRNWSSFIPQFNSGAVNSIVIHADRKFSTDLAACIAKQYNISLDNAIPVGFSGGGVYTCYSAADLASRNNSKSPNLALLLEGSCPYYYLEGQGAINAYKNSDTVFLYFENDSGYQQTQYAKLMAEAGVNVLILDDFVANGHDDLNGSFITSGLMNFAIGEGDLPKRYIIRAYDKNKGWYTVDSSKITNLNSIYNLFGLETGNVVELKSYSLAELSKLEDLTLKSDQKDLESYLNKIRGAIRSTSISTAGIAGGFSSTTMMPSQIPAIVSRYVQSTTDYLSKLANETNQFAMIGESIKNMDFNLERIAKDINDINIVSAIYGDNKDNKSRNNGDEGVVTSREQSNENITGVESGSNKGWTDKANWDAGNNGNNLYYGNAAYSNAATTVVGTPVVADVQNNIDEIDKNTNSKLYEFNKYEEIVSDNERLVIECSKGYKIVIHNDGSVINGVEHYYDFGSESKASSMLNQIKTEYEDKYFFEEILQDGQYIKVILNSDVYKGYSISLLKELYSGVEGYTQV